MPINKENLECVLMDILDDNADLDGRINSGDFRKVITEIVEMLEVAYKMEEK